ncbi:OLC1v1014113C1 [Oldenlandia corymbosa var. corymbosa]|uniref:OLC1v1014113C1 n=1 Tax=Oldenlandia corymbosa var. corymbosa TaxID=529605 RepID=A0AAV1E0A7_OLDCO|nr:OLC1v1014113C1 [Oldenlandia corymbosa var. corymbosa]
MASDDGGSVGSEDDDDFNEDFEALKRACLLTGTTPSDLQKQSVSTSAAAADAGAAATSDTGFNSDDDDDDDGFEDLQLVRDIQKKFAIVTDNREPLTLEPLCSILPGSVDKEDDFEDDMEILRAIQRRFASYNEDDQKGSLENVNPDYQKASFENVSHYPEHDGGNTLPLESCEDLFVDSSNGGVDHSYNIVNYESCNKIAGGTEESGLWQDSSSGDAAKLPVKGSSFPQAAQAFIDAIKKNRACQKLIRSKLLHIESRVEELKELKERVKILKDFQVACRRRTSLALSQKKDARAQLISVSRIDPSSKLNSKKPSPMLYGPAENFQVSKFKETVERSPAFMGRARWSKEESEKLAHGLRQQFQEMLLQRSLDLLSEGEVLGEGSGVFDGVLASIGDVDFTPEKMRLFLPKVNWEYLASMYVPGRSGPECQTRWLNHEDPLINQNPWTPTEDKVLLHVVQQKGLRNWIDIATSVGTNRTPFQCLARYQRSLNASIIKREWTEEEDNQLRAAVEAFGEGNWQFIASAIEGRTGTQCSNRWMKTLHPARQRVGRWTKDEDKRLKVAVMLFGPRNWKKIGEFVPGRTQVQCRERWVNSLDPSLNLNTWTEVEDLKLQEAIEQHGFCWSKVAACVPPRTDNQCRRRWKVLRPDQVPLLKIARETQKAALISNFVDRESERPALRPDDFVVASQEIICVPESECVNPPGRKSKGSRRRREDAPLSSCSGDPCSKEVPGSSVNGTETETLPEINKSKPGISNVAEKERQKSGSKTLKGPRKRGRASGSVTQKGSRERARILSELALEDDEAFAAFCQRSLATPDTFDYNMTLASYYSSLKKKKVKLAEK